MNVNEEMVREWLCKTDIDSWDDTDVHILTNEIKSCLRAERESERDDFKSLVHGWCDEHGAPQFEDEDCRVGHRLEWIADNRIIRPPEPEPPNPKCPVCGGEMSKPIRCGSMSRHFMKYRVECFDNSRSVEHAVAFYGSTAAEALEAARKEGE